MEVAAREEEQPAFGFLCIQAAIGSDSAITSNATACVVYARRTSTFPKHS
jgi:hypothetical protein